MVYHKMSQYTCASVKHNENNQWHNEDEDGRGGQPWVAMRRGGKKGILKRHQASHDFCSPLEGW